MRIHSPQKLKQLVELRQKGFSITELSLLLSIPISTVSHHAFKVKVPEEYIKILKAKQGGSRIRANMEWDNARLQASQLIDTLTSREKIIIASCLYWAEGSKKDFSITNSDPLLIKTFLASLAEFGVLAENIAVSIRIFEDINPINAVAFWAKVTNTNITEIRSITVLPGKKFGKLKYGMCRVRLKKGKHTFKLINSVKDRLAQVLE